MKTISIYTNVTEKCGNAEYARDLGLQLQAFYNVRLSPNLKDLVPCDVLIINWHPAVVPFPESTATTLKECGQKMVLIFQNSTEVPIEPVLDNMLSKINVIVAHEPMGDKVVYIPHGIHVYKDLPEPYEEPMIGIAGFPFPWKRFDVVAEVCKNLKVKCRMIAPRYDGMDTDGFIEGIRGHIGELADIHRNWMPIEQVVRMLAKCWLNIFWYQSTSVHDEVGQTGSARIGLASKRPIIISRHRKFRTLFPYEDEIYIADTEEQVNQFAKDILQGNKIKYPKKVLEDMGWPKVALMYKEIIDNL